MNFGGFTTPERNVVFDINDFDETLPAPWEWDVKRLAAVLRPMKQSALLDLRVSDTRPERSPLWLSDGATLDALTMPVLPQPERR